MTLASSTSHVPFAYIGDLFENAAESLFQAHPVRRPHHRAATRAAAPVVAPVVDPVPRHCRWVALRALEASGAIASYDRVVLAVMQAQYPDAVMQDARDALSWLAAAGMIDLDMRASEPWMAKISRLGGDIVAYRCDAPSDCGRPPLFW